MRVIKILAAVGGNPMPLFAFVNQYKLPSDKIVLIHEINEIDGNDILFVDDSIYPVEVDNMVREARDTKIVNEALQALEISLKLSDLLDTSKTPIIFMGNSSVIPISIYGGRIFKTTDYNRIRKEPLPRGVISHVEGLYTYDSASYRNDYCVDGEGTELMKVFAYTTGVARKNFIKKGTSETALNEMFGIPALFQIYQSKAFGMNLLPGLFVNKKSSYTYASNGKTYGDEVSHRFMMSILHNKHSLNEIRHDK